VRNEDEMKMVEVCGDDEKLLIECKVRKNAEKT
jgi:hypothetical protein